MAEFHKTTPREYTMSLAAKEAYRKFANEIANKLHDQWKERWRTHGNMSHLLYRQSTTLLIAILNVLKWFTGHRSLSESAFSECLAIHKDNALSGSYEDIM